MTDSLRNAAIDNLIARGVPVETLARIEQKYKDQVLAEMLNLIWERLGRAEELQNMIIRHLSGQGTLVTAGKTDDPHAEATKD